MMESLSITNSVDPDKTEQEVNHIEFTSPSKANESADEEPKLHARTYFALGAMFMLNMVQTLALQSPPVVVRTIMKLYFTESKAH